MCYPRKSQFAATVIAFLRGFRKSANRQIGLETRLLHDLDITGDDAAEFITCFAEEFRVDISKFRFEDYFGPEPSLANPFWWLPKERASLRERCQELSVAKLVEAAQKRRLE
jgi:hypothetical protein